MGSGKITIGLDAPPEPRDRLGGSALPKLGAADKNIPQVYSMITRRKTKRLTYIGFGLLGLTDEILGLTDGPVHPSQISIQFQRPLEFSDALRHSVRVHVEGTQDAVRLRMIRCE